MQKHSKSRTTHINLTKGHFPQFSFELAADSLGIKISSYYFNFQVLYQTIQAKLMLLTLEKGN